uniref:Uncharacterized protein n=1 Tax=Anguilla anguilla TaxID=7936 RepID=A0A0E9PFN5_ANGAN
MQRHTDLTTQARAGKEIRISFSGLARGFATPIQHRDR